MAKRKLGRGLDSLIGDRNVGVKAGERPAPGGASSSPPSRSPEPDRRAAPARDRPAGASTASESPGAQQAPSSPSEAGSPQPAETTPADAGRTSEPAEAAPPEPSLSLRSIDPARIDPNPDQPRREFLPDDMESLKSSLGREGVLQPLVVRAVGDRYQLVAGERRWRAARELGLRSVPARVIDLPDEKLLEIALIENLHRADLNPIELADAYRLLIERRRWTQKELASHLGVGRSAVANTLRLLDLPEDMKKALIRGQITVGHAKILLAAEEDARRRELFERIAEENLTVRDLEDAQHDAPDTLDDGSGKPTPERNRPPRRSPKKPYLLSLETELSEALGARVRIDERRSGKGAVSIEFYSKEDFERLRSLLLRR